MASITLKNIPEDLHIGLRARAEENHRSISQELMYLIKSSVSTPNPIASMSPEERLAFIRTNRVIPKRPLTHEEVMEGKNEGRA